MTHCMASASFRYYLVDPINRLELASSNKGNRGGVSKNTPITVLLVLAVTNGLLMLTLLHSIGALHINRDVIYDDFVLPRYYSRHTLSPSITNGTVILLKTWQNRGT